MTNDYLTYLSAPHQPCQGALVSTGEGPVQTLRCKECGFEIAAFAIHMKRPEEGGVILTPAHCDYLKSEIVETLNTLTTLTDAAALRYQARIQQSRKRLNALFDWLLQLQQREEGKHLEPGNEDRSHE